MPSSSPAKPAKKRNVARLASENVGERSRSSAQDRLEVAPGARDQHRAGHDRAGQAPQHPPVPAPVRALRDPERQQPDARHGEHGADAVGEAPGRVADLREVPADEREAHQPERHVDDEDPVPAQLDEQAPERRPHGGADAAERGPRADDGRAALRREAGEDEPQRRRRERRRARCLDDARRDEQLGRRRQSAQRGAEGEQREPGAEHAQPPDAGRPACRTARAARRRRSRTR